MAASFVRTADELHKRLTASASVNIVHQHGDGRASYLAGFNAGSAGIDRIFYPSNQVTVPKTAGVVFLEGQELWFDRSAAAATFLPGQDRDFYLGACVGDAAPDHTECTVNLNVRPAYLTELWRDEWLTAIVKTVAGSTTVEVPDVKMRGGTACMTLGATAEAQKVDLLSYRGWAVGARWIADGVFTVYDDGDATAIDFSIGVANATNASDADAITESCLLHLDGNTLDVFAESDDGTIEVAATDTTVNIALGTPVHWMIDGRNPADIQMYINGVLVLGSTVFKLDSATGPLRLLAHLEKTADDTTADYRIPMMRVRTSEQATP